MRDLFHNILDKLSVGIILVDDMQRIVMWNQWMVNKTGLKSERLIGHLLSEACPRFELSSYCGIIKNTLETGHGRFISGAVHGSFFNQGSEDTEKGIRQNLQVEAVILDEMRYVLIQVYDVTSQYKKVKQMRSFIRNLESENDEIRQTEEMSRQLALTDTLTGLSNRLDFTNHLEKAVNPLLIGGEQVAVVFLDLDGFKQVNDLHGHAIGDKVLQESAKRFKQAVRSSDLVARLGGDEFTLILNGIRTAEDVIQVANKILNLFSTPFVFGELVINVSCSFGVSMAPQDGTDPNDLIEKADIALYRVKKSGKCGFAIYAERGRIYKCGW